MGLELMIRINELPDVDGQRGGVGSRLIEESLSTRIDEIAELEIRREVIDEWIKDDDVRDALQTLDINPHCFDVLSDILDHDNNNSITMAEILDGIRRLRGDPRRSDIVAIDLIAR